jgi:predicted RNA-binding Zn-ribbon protein involved in translation (DUF1610 family)
MDTKIADEAIKEAIPVEKAAKELPEAPAVAFTNIKTPNGFSWGVTLRAETGNELVVKMEKFEKFCNLTHWEALELRSSGFKKEAKAIEYADYTCPKCGKRVVIAETSKGKVEKCETQKYDFKTKTSSGCDYVKWPQL